MNNYILAALRLEATRSAGRSKLLATAVSGALSLLLLTGCDNDNEEAVFSKVGAITVEDSTISLQTTDIDIDASFSRFSSPISRSDLERVGFFQPGLSFFAKAAGLAPDNCVAIASLSSEESDVPRFIRNGTEIEDISAGERLSVRRSGSVLVELMEDRDNKYQETVNVEYPLARDARMTVTIPGGEFGAYPTLDVPEIEQLILANPPQFPLVAGMSTINWVPSTREDSTLMLLLAGDNLLTDTTDVSVCLLIDDGDFTLPTELADALNAMNVSPVFRVMILERVRESTTSQDDSIVNIRRMSSVVEFE